MNDDMVKEPKLVEEPKSVEEPKPKARRQLPLERALTVTATEQSIAELWQRMGIMTHEELLANWSKARRAALHLLSDDIVRLIQKR